MVSTWGARTGEARQTRPVLQDLYRLVVLRKHASEVLVAGRPGFLTLPCVEIPKWTRPAENLSAAVRKRYGLSIVSLFTTEPQAAGPQAGESQYQVVELVHARSRTPNDNYWLPIAASRRRCFADEQDERVIVSVLEQIRRFQSGEARGPFGKPGWIHQLFAWAQSALAPHGIQLNRAFQQFNASPTFALLRLESNRQAVWFKAVGEPNRHELPITAALARLFPRFLPRPLAIHRDWHGWLAAEEPGATLDRKSGGDRWRQAATTLANLQISSLGKADELARAGCRDLTGISLSKQVDPFMREMARLMQQQSKPLPPQLSGEDLVSLAEQTKAAIAKVMALEIPDCLGHLDPNPGNILVSPEKCIVLDWAEGYIGLPFLTLEYFLEYLLQVRPAERGLRTGAAEGYWACWSRVLAGSVIAQCQRLGPLIAAFAFAANLAACHGPATFTDPHIGAYLRSLTRRMQREGNLLMGGSRRAVALLEES